MASCPECNTPDALILITSILCVKTNCENYDASWAEEQLTMELEEAYEKKDISKISKKLKDYKYPW